MMRKSQHTLTRRLLLLLRTSVMLALLAVFSSSVLRTAMAQENNSNSSSNSSNALFHLLATLPFTIDGEEKMNNKKDLGFSHAAAVIMALDDFYARQSNIVTPSLEGILLLSDDDNNNCTVPTTPGAWQVTIADSQSSGGASSAAVVEHYSSQQQQQPSSPPPSPLTAVVGGYYYGEMPATELALIGSALHIPTTVYGGSNLRVASQGECRYASRTFPDVLAFGEILLDYLARPVAQGGLQRTDYYGMLVPAVSEVSRQNEQVLVQAMDERNILYKSISYASDDYIPGRSLERAMVNLKATGFRTILLLLDDWKYELPMVAQAAVNAGLTNGEYVWVLVGMLDMAYFDDPNLPEDVIALVKGAATIQPIDPFRCETDTDPFLLEWQRKDASFVNRVNALLPDTSLHMPGDYFATTRPSPGSAYCYDAVMATLLASCGGSSYSSSEQETVDDFTAIAVSETGKTDDSTTSTTLAFVERLRNQVFQGASGPVRFGNSEDYPGGRTGESVTFGFLCIANPGLKWTIDDKDPGNDDGRGGAASSILVASNYGTAPGQARSAWDYKDVPFVYADGTHSPPTLLRDDPEMNYLPRNARITGFCLYGIAMVCILGSVAWIYRYRETSAMRSAQPVFLYGLLFGSTLVALCIITNSFDESYGWDAERLGRACTATPWLIITGIQLIYLCLFCKLWRINKVLQFRRRKVTVQSVILPAAGVFLIVLIVMSIWTAVGGFEWIRFELNPLTGESMGKCKGIETRAWFAPVFLLMFIPVFMVATMAWKTKDVDAKYSETKWIQMMILFQIQMVIMAIPILFLVDGVSTGARYLGQIVVFFCFSITPLLFIMVPKYLKFYFPHQFSSSSNKRGSNEGVKVSGLNSPPGPILSQQGAPERSSQLRQVEHSLQSQRPVSKASSTLSSSSKFLPMKSSSLSDSEQQPPPRRSVNVSGTSSVNDMDRGSTTVTVYEEEDMTDRLNQSHTALPIHETEVIDEVKNDDDERISKNEDDHHHTISPTLPLAAEDNEGKELQVSKGSNEVEDDSFSV